MKRVMLIYPPGKAYQRGEDRCQGNIEDSAATTIRACNDLGYAASGLKGLPYKIFLRDYQGEKLTLTDLLRDVRSYQPDLLFMSITNATIFKDLDIIRRIKTEKSDIAVILKGALFFDPPDDLLFSLDLFHVDYLIGGESDFTAARLINAHFRNRSVHHLNGILYKENGRWIRTGFSTWDSDLDQLRFPDRSLMNNRLYVRPDTVEPQATISVSRGCPFPCIYCLTPIISGKQLRKRSPENVMAELRDCYHHHGIRNFFFKSDTFTLDKAWVRRLCRMILASELAGKIEWVANSRTRPIDLETLQFMKQAGCWLVAFGFESGSPESMKLMKKGATVEDSKRAVQFARKAGLKTFGFYMIGFPWETEKHLKETERLIFDVEADFIEIHIPVPYRETDLNGMCSELLRMNHDPLGRDYFGNPVTFTPYLTTVDIRSFRKRMMFRYHMRSAYLVRRFSDVVKRPLILWNYGVYAIRLIRNLA